MTGARVRFLAPFAISVVLLVLVINAVRGEADELTAALGAADLHARVITRRWP